MRLWLLGGNPFGMPFTGVCDRLDARTEVGLPTRGISPSTNLGYRLSNSQNTSVARSRKRGGPREESFCRAWLRFGWKVCSGSKNSGGGGALFVLLAKACRRINSSKTSVLSSKNWTPDNRCSLSFALFGGWLIFPSRPFKNVLSAR
jgi:hypothetical protein